MGKYIVFIKLFLQISYTERYEAVCVEADYNCYDLFQF